MGVQLEEDFIKANPDWVAELQIMVTTKVKAEIQALSSFGFQYLSQVLAPLGYCELGDRRCCADDVCCLFLMA